MKPVSHQYEDKLLEFAYGELPAHEASAVEAHVKSCTRCTSALDQIRSVRTAMSALPAQVPSDKGLDSLLAYAEQAARRNAVAAAPKPFFSKWMKWVAPLAGVTAVLLVGGVYLQASKSIDLTQEHAAGEAAKKADAAKAMAPTAAAPTPVGHAALDAPTAAPKSLEEGEAKPADGIATVAPAENDLSGLDVTPKGAFRQKSGKLQKVRAVQRDDKDREEPIGSALAAEHKADKAAAEPMPDQGGKGGGSRIADTRNAMTEPKYQGTYGLGTGGSSNNSTLGNEMAQADKIAPARESLEKRAGPKAGYKTEDESEAYRAPAKKKSAKAEPSNNVGGGEIVNSTGSYSSGIANKPAEAKKDKKPEPAGTDKNAEVERKVAAKEAASGASSWGVHGSKDEKKQYEQPSVEQQQQETRREPAPQTQVAQAQQPPPPPAQVAPGAAPRKSTTLGLQSRQSVSAGDDDALNGADVQGPPSANTKEVARDRAARQTQLADLMKQARAADDAGELQQELKLSLQLLQSDADGDLRAEGLFRMCVGLRRIGREDDAQQYCDALAGQFPRSVWAAKLRSEQSNQRASKPKPSKSKAYQFDESEKSPAAPSPPPEKSAPSEALHAF